MPHRQHVVIVGGGASGVLMAAHLLRLPAAEAEIEVTIIERAELLGCQRQACHLEHQLFRPALSPGQGGRPGAGDRS